VMFRGLGCELTSRVSSRVYPSVRPSQGIVNNIVGSNYNGIFPAYEQHGAVARSFRLPFSAQKCIVSQRMFMGDEFRRMWKEEVVMRVGYCAVCRQIEKNCGKLNSN
jgi:hypothetical protein